MIGSLFSGIGGLELGLEAAGLGPVAWQVEIDPYCRSVLKRHWPQAEQHADIRDISKLPAVTVVCGGWPCQDISAAGKGAGLAGARSGLWWEFARVIKANRAAFVVVENVASGAKRWVDTVRGSLGQLGYETLPIPIAASDVGAPHLRRRIFIIGYNSANAIGCELWQQQGRQSGKGGANPPQPAELGAQRPAAHANSWRRESERQPAQGGEQGKTGSELDRRRGARAGVARASRPHEGWASGSPVCGVDDGTSSKLDRARLRALGNAVVPQCAMVVGEVIQLLIAQHEQ